MGKSLFSGHHKKNAPSVSAFVSGRRMTEDRKSETEKGKTSLQGFVEDSKGTRSLKVPVGLKKESLFHRSSGKTALPIDKKVADLGGIRLRIRPKLSDNC